MRQYIDIVQFGFNRNPGLIIDAQVKIDFLFNKLIPFEEPCKPTKAGIPKGRPAV